MKEQIIKIIENSSPELAAEEILNLFSVSNCDAIFEQDAKLTQEEIEEDCRKIPN